MPALPVARLADFAGAPPPVAAAADLVVTGVSLDSRAVHPGDLYAALPGAHAHGADYAAAAAAAGAVAVLTDPTGARRIAEAGIAGPGGRPISLLVVTDPRGVLGALSAAVYGHPADALTMIGITGTNGKTTTAYLVESALRALGKATGLIGTVETRIGTDRITSVRTTPEAPDLHAMLAVMRERGTQAVAMEVSSHALAQHRVDGISFDLALFTNLSQDHLDYHHDMPGYLAAKATLFTPEHARRGIVCVGDQWGRALLRGSRIPAVGLAIGAADDPGEEPGHYRVLVEDPPGFRLRGPHGTLRAASQLPGTFNVVNTALAGAALLELGYAAPDVARALAVPAVVPGRMELVAGAPGDPRCVVDYAHTPDAVEAALAALRPSTPGRLIVVLGAGGDRDRGKRRAMGAAARRWADDLIITDDNPRSEDPAAIRQEILEGTREAAGAAPDRPTHTGADRGTVVTSDAGRAAHIAQAVRLARSQGTPADNTVVVLGKGHETGQDIGGVVHPFDDRVALAAALRTEPAEPHAEPAEPGAEPAEPANPGVDRGTDQKDCR